MLRSHSSLALVGVSLAAALVLAGCSTAEPDTQSKPSETPTSSVTDKCTTSGAASEALTIDGEFGVKPTVSFDAPLSVENTERTVVLEGSGERAKAGSVVTTDFTVYHGGTGEEIDSTGYGDEATPAQIPVDENQYLEGIVRALNCAFVGERVVVVIPPADGFGDAGNTQFGITGDDAMVFVFDVLGITTPITAADAADAMVTAKADSPEVPLVEWDADGRPTIKIPLIDPPTDPTLVILEQGDGAIVGGSDTIDADYEGVIWATNETFDSSWERGSPMSYPVSNFIPGFTAALVGQNVGTKLLVIIPSDYGYGEAGSGTIAGTDTIVFVVEILGTTPA